MKKKKKKKRKKKEKKKKKEEEEEGPIGFCTSSKKTEHTPKTHFDFHMLN